VAKGKYVYLVCERAHSKARGCTYRAVAYHEAERAFREEATRIIDEAPRGKDTAELEKEIERQSIIVDVLLDQARDLADELVVTKSETVRRSLYVKDRELEGAERTLQKLQARREALTSTKVTQRLTALHEALTREPLSAKEVNAALRMAVKAIVMRPEMRTMEIHWHHADEPQEARFYTKHIKWTEGPIG
jgi:hypothetical protein